MFYHYTFSNAEKTSFTAEVDLGLNDDFQATGNLGFLQLDLTNDEENPTAASADFTLGLNDLDTDEDEDLDTGENLDANEDLDGDRLTETELRNASFEELRGIFDPAASANVNLGLNAVTMEVSTPRLLTRYPKRSSILVVSI